MADSLFATSGPPGPAGAAGATGPQGPAGSTTVVQQPDRTQLVNEGAPVTLFDNAVHSLGTHSFSMNNAGTVQWIVNVMKNSLAFFLNLYVDGTLVHDFPNTSMEPPFTAAGSFMAYTYAGIETGLAIGAHTLEVKAQAATGSVFQDVNVTTIYFKA